MKEAAPVFATGVKEAVAPPKSNSVLNAPAPGTVLAGGDLRTAEFPVRVESDFLQPRISFVILGETAANRAEYAEFSSRALRF